MTTKRNRLSEVFSVTVPSAVALTNAAKQARIALPTRTDLYARAWRRVQASPRLREYSDIILADETSDEDHLRWVVRGRVAEIAAWAEQIRRDDD
jgi:hypothetical protein